MRAPFRSLLFSLVLLVTAWPRVGATSPAPLPLEASLDLARFVVVGTITRAKDEKAQPGDGIKWQHITITTQSCLKGTLDYPLDCRYICWPSGGGRELQVGDAGIWVVGPDGLLPWSCAPLAEARQPEVESILKMLNARTWSAPVNGLVAWAGVVHADAVANPVIIFAVKNVTTTDLYVPAPISAGFVSATAVGTDGQPRQPSLSQAPSPALFPARPGIPFCLKVAPGAIIYLHPDYSDIDLTKLLPPGHYTVTITCRNDQERAVPTGQPGQPPLSAWKGTLSAPAVELTLK